MRTILLAAVASVALLGAANAATVKTVWNQGLDHPSNVNGRVTGASGCLLDTSSEFACWNDRSKDRQHVVVEEPEPDDPDMKPEG